MEEQQSLLQDECTACVCTGHRDLLKDFSSRKVKLALSKLIKEGVNTFYNGMAKGFDLCVVEALISLKKKHLDVKIIACVPYYGQEKCWCEEDQKRYVKALEKVDEKVILAPNYYKGCLQVRNRYMVDRANVMLAYVKKDTGGAAFTLRYFQKKYPHGKVVFI